MEGGLNLGLLNGEGIIAEKSCVFLKNGSQFLKYGGSDDEHQPRGIETIEAKYTYRDVFRCLFFIQ
jgi:hypothetical protein